MINFDEGKDLAMARLGGANVLKTLVNALSTERGVHADSLLCILGCLAGYACQTSVRYEFVEVMGTPEMAVFTQVKGTNGDEMLCGDILNKPLAEDRICVCSIVGGAAARLNLGNIWQKIDVNEIFKYNASVMFSDKYGIPRLPEGRGTSDSEISYLTHLWPEFSKLARGFISEDKLYLVFAFAAQEAIIYTKDAIDPVDGIRLVIESAVAMSKVKLS